MLQPGACQHGAALFRAMPTAREAPTNRQVRCGEKTPGGEGMKTAVRVPIDPKIYRQAQTTSTHMGISVDELAKRAVREALKRRKRQEKKKA